MPTKTSPARKPKIPPPPKTLWELATLGLKDLAKAEKAEGVVIDMSIWHEPRGDFCHMCFSGAVMRGTCGVKDSEYRHFGSFSGPWRSAFTALDCLRCGDVNNAYATLYPRRSSRDLSHLDRHITPYGYSPTAFKSDMRKLIADLKKEGI